MKTTRKGHMSITDPSAISPHIVHGDVDNFDYILELTAHHEAVYAYYYMDENNKVRIVY